MKKTCSMGSWLTVNRKCNLRCGWCYAKDTNYKPQDMSLGLANQLIGFLEKLGVKQTILIGGEPTIYPHLLPVIKGLLEAGIAPNLVTNGKKLADASFSEALIEAGLKKISISVKAADSLQYMELTGVDCYNDVISGYKIIKSLGVEPSLSITLVSKLIPHVERLLNNLLEEDITAVTFDMGSPVVVGDIISGEGIPDPKELADSCVNIYRFLKEKNNRFNMRISIPLCLLPDDIRNEMKDSQAIMTCCHIQGGEGLIFDQVGEILPCNHFPAHPLGKFGVDFSDVETFMNFWHGKEMEEFRNLTRRFPSEICEGCKDWDYCGGGCFLEWLYFDPNKFIKKEVK